MSVITHSATEGLDNHDDDDDFDPFLRSPLSFGTTSTVEAEEDGRRHMRRRNFGFLTYAENNVGEVVAAAADAAAGVTVAGASAQSAALFDVFDPLLSPHVYTNGVDAGPTSSSTTMTAPKLAGIIQRQSKLGVVLIDHGSKRQASNAHIHMVASMYEQISNEKENFADIGDDAAGEESSATTSSSVIVRAAHMEIATPSIIDALRDIIRTDGATHIVCVPYFLSPGRHATEDVPALIVEARDILRKEGILSIVARTMDGNNETKDDNDDDEIPILMSDALGTHLLGMLDVVDNLVLQTLNRK